MIDCSDQSRLQGETLMGCLVFLQDIAIELSCLLWPPPGSQPPLTLLCDVAILVPVVNTKIQGKIYYVLAGLVEARCCSIGTIVIT